MSLAAQSLARDIAQRFNHRAALICPANSNLVQELIDISSIDFSQQRENFALRKGEILAAYGFADPVSNDKPFAYQDGVAVIPIHGMLINRFGGSYSFVTGYNFVRSQMIAALGDSDVKLIVYDINSCGGVVSGCSELSQEIFDSRSVKPSLAVIDARCYSAAYFLGSSATRMVATPSGGVGSIGAVAIHVDYSGALDAQGIKITYIDFPEGGQKTDGNPYEALSPRAKATMQHEVDYHGELFVEAVARNRGMTAEAVQATQAACFLPPEALELGLIDDVATPTDAISQFFNDNLDADGTMIHNGPPSPKTSTSTEGIESMDEAELQARIDRGIAAGISAATAAERNRQTGIRTCEEAVGREKLAEHLAGTDLTVDAAKAILAASAKEAPPPAAGKGNGFEAAMNNTPNPNVGADGKGDIIADADTPEAKAAAILGDYVGMTGGKVIELKAVRAA